MKFQLFDNLLLLGQLEQAQRDLALYKEKVASLQKSLSEQQIQLSAMENADDPAAQSAHVASADQQSGAAEKEAQIIALTAQVKAISSDLMQAQNMIQTMDRDFNVRKSELEDTIRSQSEILAEKEQEKSDLQISMKSEQQKIIEELKLQVADLRLQPECSQVLRQEHCALLIQPQDQPR